MLNHSYYKSEMIGRIVQVTKKQRTAKEMASITFGFMSLIALISLCLWCAS